MFQFVPAETGYRFIGWLVGQIADMGARGHFHVDPTAVDDQTLSKLLPLFDDRLALDE